MISIVFSCLCCDLNRRIERLTQLGEVQLTVQFPHQLGWDAGTCSDAGAQMLKALCRLDRAVLEELQLGDEHRRHAVQSCTSIVSHGLEGSEGREGRRWEDDR